MTATDAGAPTAPADLRLLPAALAGWAGALVGTLVPPRLGLVVALLCIVAALPAAVLALRTAGSRRGAASVVAAALACPCAASLAGAWRLHTVHSGPVARLAGEAAVARAELIVTADPQPLAAVSRSSARAPEQVLIRARLEGLRARGLAITTHEPVLVVAPRDGWAALLPSQHFQVDVRMGPPQPGDDVAAWLRPLGPPELEGGPTALQQAAGLVRSRLRASTAGLAPAERGLVAGLVDGDTSQLPAAVSDDFKVAGLTHLSAVSGSNVAMVLAAVLLTARWMGLRARALPVIGVLGLGGFLVLARPEPSVLRATLMGLLVIAAMLRRGASARSGLPALCAAVLVLVLADPFLARSAGFALSVLATGGLLVLAPGWRDRLERRMPRPLAEGLAIAAAAQVACGPVLVLLAPQVSLVSIPANLLAAPAVPLATVLGVAAAVAGVVAPGLASAFAWLAAWPARWIVGVGQTLAHLPYATVAWPEGVTGALLLVVCMGAVRAAWPWAGRHPRTVLAVVVSLVTFLASPLAPGARWPPQGWIAVACDVGQGDAMVLSADGGRAIVIDAGPDPAKVDGCLRRLGVTTIGLVVLTHFHADHVEGLPGVLDGRHVAEVEVSPLADPPDEVARVRRWTSAAHVPVTVAAAGEQRAYDGIRWTVLWPSRIIQQDSMPNNASIVMRIETHGIVLLATGDVEPPAQAALMDDPNLLRADVLKVPHHGSPHQDPAFIAAVGARLAMISVGLGNDYGHPAASTIAMLQRDGAQVRRTDLDGSIALVGSSGELRLETLGPSP